MGQAQLGAHRDGARRDRRRKRGGPAEVRVDGGGSGPTLRYRPHDQRLTPPGVARDEHPWDVGGEAVGARDRATRRDRHLELLKQWTPFGPGEAQCEEHQLGRDLVLGSGYGLEPAIDELDLDKAQGPNVPAVVAEELLDRKST